MSKSSHIQELHRKHQSLSEKVDQEQRHPAADPMDIAAMKKEKLRLKEEISRLSTA
ncbi:MULTISPECIES: YdcH family protein [Rhodobacterales]|uniref:YdcH family protein n=1 Tax=Halocynthiibacter styelae TaxID=2761955 RepID=A0A8J7LPJ0_9RHOB|nr:MULTISPECIES: YdcH family protein [Rhodobacterales]MBI1493661.1 YdcH family protein [Paenihalocynthiibacter styelae]